MTDCYRILGVTRNATTNEIRAAYLARMKQCHPDVAPASDGGSPLSHEAARLAHAYWQLRDPHRREAHDRELAGVAQGGVRRPPHSRRLARGTRQSVPSAMRSRRSPVGTGRNLAAASRQVAQRRAPAGRRLQSMRIGAGAAAFAVAIAGFYVAFTQIGPGPAPVHASTILDASLRQLRKATGKQRPADPLAARSANQEFRRIFATDGFEGAHRFARQCLLELSLRPSMNMLDFCRTFEEAAAAFERARRGEAAAKPQFFAADQRYGRLLAASRDMRDSEVRHAMVSDLDFIDDANPDAQ